VSAPREVPPAARADAARLRELFDRDRRLAVALNAAQRQLNDANDQLTSGLSAEALRAVWGPMGPDLGLSGRKPPVLAEEQPIAALERVAYEIHSAFLDYQRIADERRVLGVDVGEVNARMAAVLEAAGFSADEVRCADVDALAAGRFEPAHQEKRAG
jgi:hypothetical protein